VVSVHASYLRVPDSNFRQTTGYSNLRFRSFLQSLQEYTGKLLYNIAMVKAFRSSPLDPRPRINVFLFLFHWYLVPKIYTTQFDSDTNKYLWTNKMEFINNAKVKCLHYRSIKTISKICRMNFLDLRITPCSWFIFWFVYGARIYIYIYTHTLKLKYIHFI
jgi:hypothetical protein